MYQKNNLTVDNFYRKKMYNYVKRTTKAKNTNQHKGD